MNGKPTLAVKDHYCLLCGLKIKQWTVYWRETITPWDHPDNEIFHELKTHMKCWELWQNRDTWVDTFPDHPIDFRDDHPEHFNVCSECCEDLNDGPCSCTPHLIETLTQLESL